MRIREVPQTKGFVARGVYAASVPPAVKSIDYAGRMQTMTNWSNYAGNSGARVTTWKYDGYRGWLTNKVYAGNVKGSTHRMDSAEKPILIFRRIFVVLAHPSG